MPSSYTSLLRFELPVQGELSGTWGNVVNTAITTPVSEAIAGTTSISVGATDYTLTNGDGASANEARKMFITATGSPGAARNVICPATSKLYVFRNDTSGGFAMTLKTSAGSGVAVPAGQSRLLYCNGTDVVEAVNSFASPIFTGTPTAPTASPGTNTTQLATTAFVQAALPAAFPAGTAMLFVQTSAPTGWTKSTTHNDKALRVVSGAASSGGTTAFSTVFTNQTPTISNTLSVSNTTLTTTQIPSHTHNVGGGSAAAAGCGFNWAGNTASAVSGATGGGGAHNHGLSGGITSTAVTLNVQYVDVIIATKD